LPKSFAVQVVAFRSRVQYHYEFFTPMPSQFRTEDLKYSTDGHSWEIPVILKKYVAEKFNVRVFPLAGISFRRTDAITHFQDTVTGTVCNVPPLNCDTTVTTLTVTP